MKAKHQKCFDSYWAYFFCYHDASGWYIRYSFTFFSQGVLSGVKALIEWEKTLQLLGVIGISHAIYQRFSSYESVDDLKTDIRNLQKPFKLAAQGVLWVAGLLEPSKLQLATSPSTSAVQDKVIQAAAKHGSLPSEPGQEETPEEATDET